MARFRYGLESLFNDERNDAFSKLKAGDRGRTGFVERSIRLDSNRLGSEYQGRLTVVVAFPIAESSAASRLTHARAQVVPRADNQMSDKGVIR